MAIANTTTIGVYTLANFRINNSVGAFEKWHFVPVPEFWKVYCLYILSESVPERPN